MTVFLALAAAYVLGLLGVVALCRAAARADAHEDAVRVTDSDLEWLRGQG
jgi:hypothetical protein